MVDGKVCETCTGQGLTSRRFIRQRSPIARGNVNPANSMNSAKANIYGICGERQRDIPPDFCARHTDFAKNGRVSDRGGIAPRFATHAPVKRS